MSRPMFFSIKITLSNNLKGTHEIGNLSLKTLDHCDWVYKLSTIHKKIFMEIVYIKLSNVRFNQMTFRKSTFSIKLKKPPDLFGSCIKFFTYSGDILQIAVWCTSLNHSNG